MNTYLVQATGYFGRPFRYLVKATTKAYDQFSPEEKKKWFNAVLSILGFEFEEDDLPYMRSSLHVESFREEVERTARNNFPLLYIALIEAKHAARLTNDIYKILRNWP